MVLWLLRTLALRIVYQRTEEPRVRYQWRQALGYVTLALGLLIVGRIWYRGFESLATFLGLLSAGLAVALSDLVAGVAGWFFILSRRPFRVGDRVQIGDDRGDVIDIDVFQTTLLEIGNWVDAEQSTGRMIHIPNSTRLVVQ